MLLIVVAFAVNVVVAVVVAVFFGCLQLTS